MSKSRIGKFVIIVLVAVAAYAWRQYVGPAGPDVTPPNAPQAPEAPGVAGASEDADAAGNLILVRSGTGRTNAPGAARGDDRTAPNRNGDARIAEAFRRQQSDVVVESKGRVTRVLPDDEEGSRHQRFVLRLANDMTVLIAHNIDLAPRLPLTEGDTVRFHGEYEWGERGGVVHWTHRDPGERHEDGWLELAGKRYD